MDQIKLPFYARLALILIAIGLVLVLLSVGRSIFIPLFFGLLVALLLYPLVRRFEKWHMGRGLSILLAILLFFLSFALLVYLFSIQIADFAGDIPKLQARINEVTTELQHWIARKYHVNRAQQLDYINRSTSSILNNVATSIGSTFLGVMEFLIWGVFVVFYAFFILYYRKMLTRFLQSLFHPHDRDQVGQVVVQTRTVINSYMIGLLTEMTILLVINSIVFLVLGLKYALLMALLASVLNIVPYLGIYTATIICMIITFANTTGNEALIVGGVMLGIHFLDANILMPRIVGGRVKMNPFITLIAVVAGNLLWGISGMFLFIPLTAIIKIISERVEELKPWAILIGEEQREKSSPPPPTEREKKEDTL